MSKTEVPETSLTSFVIIFRNVMLPTQGKVCEWVRDPLHYLSIYYTCWYYVL